MYSGNHSLASPVTTIVEAALRLRDDNRFLFMFIGGGHGKRAVDAAIAKHQPPNIVSLPYQPLDQLMYSLSAADLHVVTLGDDMVGIIHPCKIYGAMSVGRPVLFVGPAPSHAADIFQRFNCGWQVHHGDVAGAIAAIESAASLSVDDRDAIGRRGQSAIKHEFSKRRVLAALCDLFGEQATASAGHPQTKSPSHPSAHEAIRAARTVEIAKTQ